MKNWKKIIVIENLNEMSTPLLTTFEQFGHLADFLLVLDNRIIILEERIYGESKVRLLQMLFDRTWN